MDIEERSEIKQFLRLVDDIKLAKRAFYAGLNRGSRKAAEFRVQLFRMEEDMRMMLFALCENAPPSVDRFLSHAADEAWGDLRMNDIYPKRTGIGV